MTRNGLLAARVVAGFLALFMAAYFATDNFGGDSVRRLDNPFLLPDLLIVVLLGVSAALPRRLAAPALIFSLAWSAAVWATSLAHWLVDGEVGRGLGHLALVLPAVAAAVVAAVSSRSSEPRSGAGGIRSSGPAPGLGG
ncbi:hypothetical protein [Kribbella sp. HUAS MG21]|uniref:DoxX family protein n=1 Tax=Kribbella sp. HUAS MG21 TaxID=3160966 RepID=A0AAU7T7B4_9ACTN